ncbi:MAG: hypothetical protein MHM6MM_007249 [Cercozoa sp. M6MM]
MALVSSFVLLALAFAFVVATATPDKKDVNASAAMYETLAELHGFQLYCHDCDKRESRAQTLASGRATLRRQPAPRIPCPLKVQYDKAPISILKKMGAEVPEEILSMMTDLDRLDTRISKVLQKALISDARHQWRRRNSDTSMPSFMKPTRNFAPRRSSLPATSAEDNSKALKELAQQTHEYAQRLHRLASLVFASDEAKASNLFATANKQVRFRETLDDRALQLDTSRSV